MSHKTPSSGCEQERHLGVDSQEGGERPGDQHDPGNCHLTIYGITETTESEIAVTIDQRGPVVQGALLRGKLAELRKTSTLTQEMVAKTLEWHPSKIIRIEGGRTGISKVDLEALGRLYGVADGPVMAELQTLHRESRAKAWWDDFKNVVTDALLTYVGYEAGASAIRQFQPLAVPGLLQTAEYAKAVVPWQTDQALLDQRVRFRLRRQEMLRRRENPPRETFVIDEAALRRYVGIRENPTIMPRQLRHMADMAEESAGITLHVVPFDSGAHVGMLLGAFTLLEFDEVLAPVLHLESGAGQETVIGDDQRVSAANADFKTIVERALSAAESLSFIRRIADEMS
jgi:DNA-binding XRE family transcriptional regulator